MTYTISDVGSVNEYQSKYGPMKNYNVKFNETGDTIVQWSKKASSPAPQVGDVLEGTIDMSGEYGPKFKQDYQAKDAPVKGAKVDPHTMYVAYAKDIVVALLPDDPTTDEFKTKFEKALSYVRAGAAVLEKTPEQRNTENVAKTFGDGGF